MGAPRQPKNDFSSADPFSRHVFRQRESGSLAHVDPARRPEVARTATRVFRLPPEAPVDIDFVTEADRAYGARAQRQPAPAPIQDRNPTVTELREQVGLPTTLPLVTHPQAPRNPTVEELRAGREGTARNPSVTELRAQAGFSAAPPPSVNPSLEFLRSQLPPPPSQTRRLPLLREPGNYPSVSLSDIVGPTALPRSDMDFLVTPKEAAALSRTRGVAFAGEGASEIPAPAPAQAPLPAPAVDDSRLRFLRSLLGL